ARGVGRPSHALRARGRPLRTGHTRTARARVGRRRRRVPAGARRQGRGGRRVRARFRGRRRARRPDGRVSGAGRRPAVRNAGGRARRPVHRSLQPGGSARGLPAVRDRRGNAAGRAAAGSSARQGRAAPRRRPRLRGDSPMRIEDCNWMQVEHYLEGDDRLVIPLGSIEQHAYLSLGVDRILSERVSVEAAEPLGVLVLPSLPYGLTPYFAAYPGSPTLRVETYRALLRDLLDSLAEQGF